MQLNDKSYLKKSSCHSKEYTENNISLNLTNTLMLGASHIAQLRQNTHAVMCLQGICNFVGFNFHFVSFLYLPTPYTIRLYAHLCVNNEVTVNT